MRSFLVLLFFFLVSLSSSGQRKEFKINGIVKDSIGVVADAHIINLSSKYGTFSNDYGQFKMKVSAGDTLQISSIQHFTKKQIISSKDQRVGELEFYLNLDRLKLQEVVVKNHNLSKILSVDALIRKKSATEKKKNELQNLLSTARKAGAINAIGSQPSDRGTAGEITKATDPTKGFRGMGFGFSLGRSRNKSRIKVQQLKATDYKIAFIIRKVKRSYFDELDIPQNLVTHFLRQYDLQEPYQLANDDKMLELLNLLEKNSLDYLKKRKSLTKE